MLGRQQIENMNRYPSHRKANASEFCPMKWLYFIVHYAVIIMATEVNG